MSAIVGIANSFRGTVESIEGHIERPTRTPPSRPQALVSRRTPAARSALAGGAAAAGDRSGGASPGGGAAAAGDRPGGASSGGGAAAAGDRPEGGGAAASGDHPGGGASGAEASFLLVQLGNRLSRWCYC